MTETKVYSNIKIMNIPGYEIIRRDRTGSGGGVAIIYKSYVKCKMLETSTITNDESKIELLSCKFQIGMRKSFIVSVLYRPKFNLTLSDIDFFESIISDLKLFKCNFFICGDFNIHLENTCSPNVKKFNRLLLRHSLRELVQTPTRQGARLDLILTNDDDISITAKTCQPLVSDHDATFINDTQLVIAGPVHMLPYLIHKLKSDLLAILEWMDKNGMTLNLDKTQFILIGSTSNLNKVGVVEFEVNGIVIKSQNELKSLGLIIDSKLSWSKHINSISRRFHMVATSLYPLKKVMSQSS
ncbi:uncharacterized protein LOC118435748 [Folsomia candida]|uniref:uncharacterized protein LOC118435748 n=1 Tax=Folsomia candida TaxID=158441 RepID=UPI001604C7FA|nr:uncharacterized protein LOC118435748 [Folsomia candida]